MFGEDPVVGGGHRAVLFVVSCLSRGFLLSGCPDIRRVVGMDRVGPDEFAVESRAPLTIPPEYDLRPPQPGAPRPQEASSADKARKVIDTAGPGRPRQQAPARRENPARGGGRDDGRRVTQPP